MSHVVSSSPVIHLVKREISHNHHVFALLDPLDNGSHLNHPCSARMEDHFEGHFKKYGANNCQIDSLTNKQTLPRRKTWTFYVQPK